MDTVSRHDAPLPGGGPLRELDGTGVSTAPRLGVARLLPPLWAGALMVGADAGTPRTDGAGCNDRDGLCEGDCAGAGVADGGATTEGGRCAWGVPCSWR